MVIMNGTRESAILRGRTREIITLTNRESGSPLTRILSPEKSSLPRSRFQAIAFHFYPHSAKVKLYPPKTPKWEDKKKAAQRLTFLSKHVPGTQPLPFAIFFFAPLGDIWKFLAIPCPVIVTFDFLVTE